MFIGYGGILELLQENFIQGRYGSWMDFFANAIGCLIGIGFTSLLLKYYIKHE